MIAMKTVAAGHLVAVARPAYESYTGRAQLGVTGAQGTLQFVPTTDAAKP